MARGGWRGGGRPPLPPGERKRNVTVALHPGVIEMLDRLRVAMQSEGRMSKNELVELAIFQLYREVVERSEEACLE